MAWYDQNRLFHPLFKNYISITLLMNDYTISKTRICDETPQYRTGYETRQTPEQVLGSFI